MVLAHDRPGADVAAEGDQLGKDAAIEEDRVADPARVPRRNDRRSRFVPSRDEGVDHFGLDAGLIAQEKNHGLNGDSQAGRCG